MDGCGCENGCKGGCGQMASPDYFVISDMDDCSDPPVREIISNCEEESKCDVIVQSCDKNECEKKHRDGCIIRFKVCAEDGQIFINDKYWPRVHMRCGSSYIWCVKGIHDFMITKGMTDVPFMDMRVGFHGSIVIEDVSVFGHGEYYYKFLGRYGHIVIDQ